VVDIRSLVTAFSVFDLAENREDDLSYLGIATLVVRVWIPDGILDHLYQLIHLVTATQPDRSQNVFYEGMVVSKVAFCIIQLLFGAQDVFFAASVGISIVYTIPPMIRAFCARCTGTTLQQEMVRQSAMKYTCRRHYLNAICEKDKMVRTLVRRFLHSKQAIDARLVLPSSAFGVCGVDCFCISTWRGAMKRYPLIRSGRSSMAVCDWVCNAKNVRVLVLASDVLSLIDRRDFQESR